ncbi:MAG: Lrp/AsnC family transcriptional regulator [Nanoarchaeota archaeon]|nr:Lrp/AsnC family transcriptional regulator [Nanoarchaeota archaeon]
MVNLNKQQKILCQLRKDARMPLTTMSRKTGIAVSTIFDKIKSYQGDLITKHTCLINFGNLGYSACAKIIVKVDREKREELKKYLNKNPNVNSLFKINNGYDFMFEAIFPNLKDIEDFLESMEDKFRITEKQVFYIIEDIKRECFMEDYSITV